MSFLEKYIEKYGKEEGEIKYKELCAKKAFTLENQIAKYGIEDGTRRYNEKREKDKLKGTLQYYVEKYGKEEGESRYKEKNSKLSVGIETLKRNGKTPEEIESIRSNHSKNSAITLENFIEKYGEFEGIIRYNNYIQKVKSKSLRTIEGWIYRGCSEEKAKIALQDYQANTSIDKFIDRYGVDEGTKQYLDLNHRKTRNWIKNRNSISKLEISFFSNLSNIIELDLEKGRNCRIYCESKLYCCDYFHPQNNKIIEIFGDFWHMNPKTYNMNDLNVVIKKSAKEIWDLDELKINNLEKFGYKTLVIWEDDIKQNLNQQLFLAKRFLET